MRTLSRNVWVVMVAAIACAHHEPVPSKPLLPARPVLRIARGKIPPSADTSYWEPFTVALPERRVPEAMAPVKLSDVEQTAAGAPLLAEAARTKGFLARGFAVFPPNRQVYAGERYATWAEAGIPVFFTFDVLAFFAHLAVERMVAEAEHTFVLPRFRRLLTALDSAVAVDTRKVGADLAPAFSLAAQLVGVARSLLDEAYVPKPEVRDLVRQELRLISLHERREKSPVLGVHVDYTLYAALPAPVEPLSAARYAALWLSQAPLNLLGQTEISSAEETVGRSRHAIRAALLLARATAPLLDKQASEDLRFFESFYRFLFGASDEVSLLDLARAAEGLGYDVADLKTVSDITRVDRLRHVLAKRTKSEMPDGASAAVVNVHRMIQAPTVRLFTPAAPAEMAAFAEFARFRVGFAPSVNRYLTDTQVSGLDIAAFLGSEDAARLALTATDARRGAYDAILFARRNARENGSDERRHDSVYASGVDAIATYLRPSVGDGVNAPTANALWGLHKLESGLASWAQLRSDTAYFGRSPLPAVPAQAGQEFDPSRVRVLVEPHPEAIVKLVAMLAQLWKGLSALGAVSKTGTARIILVEVDALLRIALSVAAWSSQGLALPPELAAQAATLPRRMLQLETELLASGACEPAVAKDVHHDLDRGRVFHVAAGPWQQLGVLVQRVVTPVSLPTPQGGAPASAPVAADFAMGLTLPYFEYMQDAHIRQGSAGWRASIEKTMPPPPEFTHLYR
jgi:hypothetical protein